MHVDMDAYFASVEQQEVPGLRGKPVVVCGDPRRRSVVATASYEARALGVKTGMSVQEARRVAPAAYFVEGDPAKYVAISLRIINILCRFSPAVEPYSIDEAFIDATGCPLAGDPHAMADRVKGEIKHETGLTCSVGIGPNKLLAKTATEFHKPDGITRLETPDVPAQLWPLSVGKLYGVGEKTADLLRSMNIQTIGQLAEVPAATLREIFGINGAILWNSARGIDDSPVDPSAALTCKSCGHELTFEHDLDDKSRIRGYTLYLCEGIARRMRRDGYKGRTVTVKLRNAGFETITRAHTRPGFTDDSAEIHEEALKLLHANWQGEPLRMLGVSVSNFLEAARLQNQLTLFGGSSARDALTRAVDRIRDKYGESAVTRASFLELER